MLGSRWCIWQWFKTLTATPDVDVAQVLCEGMPNRWLRGMRCLGAPLKMQLFVQRPPRQGT